LHLDITTSPDAIVTGDLDHLRRLLGNVIDNAVRYARTSIRNDTTVQELAVVTVDDDGPGVPDTERARVFNPFIRLDVSRERGSGTTGLGLAIAREIARAHHGTVAMARSPAGGARVVICFPQRTPAGSAPGGATDR